MRTTTSTSKATAPIRSKLSKKATKPVKVVETKAKAAPATDLPKGVIALKQICGEIGINPKVARRELRKVRKEAIDSKEASALKKHDLHTRWVFAKSDPQVAEIRKTLAAYVARNGKSE